MLLRLRAKYHTMLVVDPHVVVARLDADQRLVDHVLGIVDELLHDRALFSSVPSASPMRRWETLSSRVMRSCPAYFSPRWFQKWVEEEGLFY